MTTPAIPDSLEPLLHPISDLRSYPGNPRRGNIDLIVDSLRRHGQYRPIVANRRTSEVLGGNHTLAAARQLGWEQVAVTWVDVDPEEAARIVLIDNRASDLAGYDDAGLAELLQGLPDLDGTGWSEGDLSELLASITDPPRSDTDPDDVPEPPSVPVSKLGDVWDLGPHRLVCGDSTDPEVLDLLMGGGVADIVVTDPPYGMALDADYSKLPGGNAKSGMRKQPKKYEQVIGDDQAFDASPLRSYFAATREQFWFGADYYRRTLSPDDRDGSWLIWDKRKEDGSQDDVIGSTFETCWSAVPHQRRLLRHYWCGAFGAPEARNRVHPTQKPVALLAEILTRWGRPGGVVTDLFGGSGSTLIAAHTTAHVARLVELDPRYVDVICRRFQAHTGTVPVLQATGEPHDFTMEV